MANQTGTVKILALELNGRNLMSAFTSCTIYEDLLRNVWSGHIDIIETENARETIPIIGEEIIIIRFASLRPVSGEADTTIQFVGRITKLKNYREGTSSQRRYRLHFQSIWAEVNKAKRCRKAYTGTGTDIASKIMKNLMGQEFQTVDPAKYSEHFVFPNWNPFQCINFLAGVSVSAKYNDPAYFLYEDRDGYHFTTLSQLMDKSYVDTVQVKLVQGSTDKVADDTLTSIISFDPLFDTIETAEEGMYGSTLITYDKVNKQYDEITSTYSETYDEWVHLGKEKLTDIRAESPKNRFQFMFANDTVNPGPYTQSREWALKGMIRAPQVRGHRVHLYLNRSTDYKIGDVLQWDIKTTQDSNTPDKILSGNWMITRIRHTFNQVAYNAHVELVKDGRG